MDAFWMTIRGLGIAIGAVLVFYGAVGLIAAFAAPQMLQWRLFNERAVGRGPRTRKRLGAFFAWSVSWGTYLVLSLAELATHGMLMTLILFSTVLAYFAFFRKHT
jgi:hypothetical protein